jgi:hypothetical protein
MLAYKTMNSQIPKTPANKAFYVEEQVTILQSIIMQADPILNELVSKVKQFERYSR